MANDYAGRSEGVVKAAVAVVPRYSYRDGCGTIGIEITRGDNSSIGLNNHRCRLPVAGTHETDGGCDYAGGPESRIKNSIRTVARQCKASRGIRDSTRLDDFTVGLSRDGLTKDA